MVSLLKVKSIGCFSKEFTSVKKSKMSPCSLTKYTTGLKFSDDALVI
ncbi:hypothetical protein [Aquimarina agarivorans]|nr:hypothetical protein [Aquimarina agarivorans]